MAFFITNCLPATARARPAHGAPCCKMLSAAASLCAFALRWCTRHAVNTFSRPSHGARSYCAGAPIVPYKSSRGCLTMRVRFELVRPQCRRDNFRLPPLSTFALHWCCCRCQFSSKIAILLARACTAQGAVAKPHLPHPHIPAAASHCTLARRS